MQFQKKDSIEATLVLKTKNMFHLDSDDILTFRISLSCFSKCAQCQSDARRLAVPQRLYDSHIRGRRFQLLKDF